MKRKRKEKVNKEEICEDWCFVCKDGGSLFICDYKDCLKAYHAECVEKDESFFDNGGRLTCDWHTCFGCRKKRIKFQCYCCPKAWCDRCSYFAKFAKLRGSRGFCDYCLKILLLGEEHKEEDSDGGKVDMKDRDTYECLLYEYWLAIKGKENLNLKDLQVAHNLLKKDDTEKALSSASVSEEYANESLESSSEEDSRSDFSMTPSKKGKRSKGQRSSNKTEVNSKKREFIGWGSKAIIDFLASIGKDTSKELSETDMISIINGYIAENKLFIPERKKTIVCDEKLKVLFGKRTFKRNNVGKLLELHFRENAEFYEQDQLCYASEENSDNDDIDIASRKQKNTDTSKKSQKMEVVIESNKSTFAAINLKNVKLVYLKRFVVMELLKELGTFESKVIGAFVRVQSNPYDYEQKNPYQLVRVTGVKKTSPGLKKEDILLQVSERIDEFPIIKLSDADFSEEECEDLRHRVKSGQLPKLATVEMEEKAKGLHQIIMKHWITQELASLQNRIDQANEKGWRKELHNFMERRLLLETEVEQKRLLEEVPQVIAEIPETIPEDASKESEHGDEIPLKSILTKNLESIDKRREENVPSSGDKAITSDKSLSGNSGSNYGNGTINGSKVPSNIEGDKFVTGDNSSSGDAGSVSANCGDGTIKRDEVPLNNLDEAQSAFNHQSDAVQRSEPRQPGPQIESQSNDVAQIAEKTAMPLVIELSSDDDSDDKSSTDREKLKPEELDTPMWLLFPCGAKKGPVSLSLLKKWHDGAPYALKCKVWKEGESEENAIMVPDAVRKFYPGNY